MYSLVVYYCVCTGNPVNAAVLVGSWEDGKDFYVQARSADYTTLQAQADAIFLTVKRRAKYRREHRQK